MEEILLGLLVIVAVIGGWVLGIVGFFSARRALRETDLLRRQLAAQHGQAGVAGAGPAAGPAPGTLAQPWGQVPGQAQEQPPAPADAARAQPPWRRPPWRRPPGPPPRGTVAPFPPPPGMPIPQPMATAREPARDLEALLTLRWGIWLGAAALLLAGVFLIRYAVEQELMGPPVRCALAFLLGSVLIAAAEWLRRRDVTLPGVGADQAPAALVAGGVAVLFGAAYGTGPLYDLVPPFVGFILLAATAFLGLALSLRFGRLVAVIGVACAFLTPALIETDDPSVPGLFIYLLFVSAAALAVVRYTAWVWLAWATTFAGAAWVLIGIAADPGADVWAPSLFVPASAALHLVLLPTAALDHPIGRRLSWVPIAVPGVAGVLLAWAYPGDITRIGVLLLSPLLVWKAAAEPRLRLLPYLGALFFLAILAVWSVRMGTAPMEAALLDPVPPDTARAMLATAALGAGFFAACGLWFQLRAPFPLAWAGLTAAVPVLALAVCYARVAMFHTRVDWAIVAFLLTAGLVGTTAFSMHRTAAHARQVAGAHAAGAVGALALGCGMLLSDQWLTLAVALFLPALAWVEDKAELPALRRIAIPVAAFVLIRLLANWYVLDYAFGTLPILNGLLPTYGVAAAAFAVAAALFRRRGDDLVVGLMEAGAVAFTTVLVGLEVRHLSVGGDLARPDFSFAEAGLHVSSLAVMAAATMRIAARLGRVVLRWAWRVQGGLALAGGVLLLILNPYANDEPVGAWPFLDWLLPAYLLPAAIALDVARHPASAQPPGLRRVLFGYALLAVFVWITLEIRHLFHGSAIDAGNPVEAAELWAWSGAWLVYGGALLVAGLRTQRRPLRLAALAIIGLATAKVFLIDMGELTGLWRVLSFLGLGLALIGFGALYRRLAGGRGTPGAAAGEQGSS